MKKLYFSIVAVGLILGLIVPLAAYAVPSDYDFIVDPNNPYQTDIITLPNEISFYYFLSVLDPVPQGGTWDVFYQLLRDGVETTLKETYFNSSSGDWAFQLLTVPSQYVGTQARVRFEVKDYTPSGPSVYIKELNVAPVPEPSTLLLLGAGLLGLVAYGRKKLRK